MVAQLVHSSREHDSSSHCLDLVLLEYMVLLDNWSQALLTSFHRHVLYFQVHQIAWLQNRRSLLLWRQTYILRILVRPRLSRGGSWFLLSLLLLFISFIVLLLRHKLELSRERVQFIGVLIPRRDIEGKAPDSPRWSIDWQHSSSYQVWFLLLLQKALIYRALSKSRRVCPCRWIRRSAGCIFRLHHIAQFSKRSVSNLVMQDISFSRGDIVFFILGRHFWSLLIFEGRSASHGVRRGALHIRIPREGRSKCFGGLYN